MRIVVLGRGNVGGGLAKLWTTAGHHVTTIGRDGGDASDADVVVVAVPATAIADALGSVKGIEGKVTIDTTNVLGADAGEFPSLAHLVKSIVNGPVAKSFNTNFAALYDQIASQAVRPSNLYAADDGARDVTEQLIKDAGYDPVFVGGLDKAPALESYIAIAFGVAGSMGQFFYRMSPSL
jgi:predicted dinucleotide-binding enzyme